MPENFTSVIPLLSNVEDKINSLFETDKIFQDLCKDYVLCLYKVRDLKNELRSNEAQFEEYSQLKHCLEQDIVQMING